MNNLAGEDDLARDEENRRRRAEGRLAARRLIREHELPMKITAVDFIGSENVFVVYFSAPHRVDFRALVRDLGARLRAGVDCLSRLSRRTANDIPSRRWRHLQAPARRSGSAGRNGHSRNPGRRYSPLTSMTRQPT